MDIDTRSNEVVEAVRSAQFVDPTGSKTHADLGHKAHPDSVELRAPAGIISHDPDDLVVTALAGTSVAELAEVLNEHDQCVPLDPRHDASTIGGTIASGLSGIRRLGFGPLRDYLLEVRLITGYGSLVKSGGPTVKNVTGFDIPKLLVGSLGNLGMIVQATFRCRPLPVESRWYSTSSDPDVLLQELFRPTAIASDSFNTYVLLSGVPADVDCSRRLLEDCTEISEMSMPDGLHRGRIAVPPSTVAALVAQLEEWQTEGLSWLAEWGIGTIHVAADTSAAIAFARHIAHDHGGWLLREAGADDIDPFGVAVPNQALTQNVKRAFDPDDKMASGRFG